ncbi:MAG: FHA domain-containing protein [Myxococcales bacterium]|nr:FHA domain-containing protein [Myxococcales bacterium]
MRELRAWLADANRLDEAAYCAAHPYPLLVHATTGYQLRPITRTVMMTMDQAVLDVARRPAQPPSALDDYVAFAVRGARGVPGFQVTIGCADESDIVINDVTVSKLHATLMQDRRGHWYIQDAGSTTGTHVNDQDPSETQILVSGDRVSLGMVDLVFYLPSQAYQLIRRLV